MDNTALKETLNGMALKLGTLGLLMLAFVGITTLILKPIPIFKELKQFIIGIVLLISIYIWYKIYF